MTKFRKITFYTQTFSKSLDLNELGFEQAKTIIAQADSTTLVTLNFTHLETSGQGLVINMAHIVFIEYE